VTTGYATTGYTTTGYANTGYAGSGVGHRPVTEEIPVESRIEYIPFETKHIEYDQVERVERIPFER